jgi:hypothetical protein
MVMEGCVMLEFWNREHSGNIRGTFSKTKAVVHGDGRLRDAGVLE